MTATLPHDATTGEAAKRCVIEYQYNADLAALVAEAAMVCSAVPTQGSSGKRAPSVAEVEFVDRVDAFTARAEAELERYADSVALQHVVREGQALAGRMYLRSRGVPRMLDGLVQQVLATRPRDPVAELIRLVEARMMMAQPPRSSPGLFTS
jgi:hypothetical protein